MVDLPSIIAHRGARDYAPENTLLAIDKAADMGATWVEIDVQLSKDNQLVVIHDDHLERTTNGVGKVCHSTLAELKALNANAGFDCEVVMPTLQEVLATCAKRQLHLNIELKRVKRRHQACLVDQVLQVLQACCCVTQQVLLSSFSVCMLRLVRQRGAYYPLALNVTYFWWWHHIWVKKLQCVSVHFDQRWVRMRVVRCLQQAGFQVAVFTVNELTRAQWFWRRKISVFTDDLSIGEKHTQRS